jgi:RsiW-degrading membrane proteinase PrsW (M82 family)
MNTRYWWALGLAAIGFGAVALMLLNPDVRSDLLIVAAAALPLAVLFAVQGKLGEDVPLRAIVGGAVIGAVVAVLAYGLVFTLAYTFVGGFADAATEILDALRVDPALTEALGMQWLIVAAISAVVVAPITEEIGTAAGGLISRPSGRKGAFAAGVAAGAGFAVLENLAYAFGGGFFTDPTAIVLVRSLGAAVHPLASGLVVLGWWEWRNGDGADRLFRGFLSGVGVHALWNASLVALAATEIAYEPQGTEETLAAVSLAYSAAIGAIMAAALWQMTRAVAGARDPLRGFAFEDSWSIAAWTVLTASFLVPVVVLIIAYPGFG